MIAPRKLTVLSDVPVSHSARHRPGQASTAAEHDGDRLAKAAELQQQHSEDQRDPQKEHDQQVAEAFLLLLKQAAELDDARWN